MTFVPWLAPTDTDYLQHPPVCQVHTPMTSSMA